VSALLAFGFSLAVGHLFRAVGTGAFFEVVALFTVASYIGTMGADVGLTRILPYLKVHGRTRDIRRVIPVAVLPSVLITCALAVGLFVWAPALAHLVTHVPSRGAPASGGGHDFIEYLRIVAPFLPLATLTGVLVAGARGFDSMWPAVAVQNIIVPIARLLLLMVFLLAGLGAVAVGLSWGIPVILGAVGCLMALRLLASRAGSPGEGSDASTPLPRLAVEFWSYAAPRGVGAAFSFIVLWLDIVLVGALASTRQAGVYAIASRYVILATFPMVALGFAIAPQISRLVSSGQLDATRRIFQAGTAWLVSLAWPGCLVMGVFAPLLMRVFGKEFVSGSTSLSILCLAMLINTGAGNCGVVLAMTGRTGINLMVAALGAVVDVGGNVVLVPHIGMRGAALAWAATMVLVNGLTVAFLVKAFGLHPFGRATVRVGVSSLLCFGGIGLALRGLLGPTWVALIIAVALGLPAYLALIWRSRHELGLHAFRALATSQGLEAGDPNGAAGPVTTPSFGADP
jgi:O-antigen/teichoic acid export membrane protein